MKFPMLLIGAAAFAVSGAATAQSAPAAPQATAPGAGSAPSDLIVSASADVDTPTVDPDTGEAIEQTPPPATPPKPHRAARVTTCRCGDPGQSGQ